MEQLAKNLKARIYRNALAGTWTVLVRDTVYDDCKVRKYVSQRDFDTLAEAEAFAIRETGRAAAISF